MLDVLMTIIGVVFIAAGVVTVLNKMLFQGIVYILIGVVILLGGWLFVEIVLLVFGVLLIARGVLDFAAAFKINSPLTLITSVLTIVPRYKGTCEPFDYSRRAVYCRRYHCPCRKEVILYKNVRSGFCRGGRFLLT